MHTAGCFDSQADVSDICTGQAYQAKNFSDFQAGAAAHCSADDVRAEVSDVQIDVPACTVVVTSEFTENSICQGDNAPDFIEGVQEVEQIDVAMQSVEEGSAIVNANMNVEDIDGAATMPCQPDLSLSCDSVALDICSTQDSHVSRSV